MVFIFLFACDNKSNENFLNKEDKSIKAMNISYFSIQDGTYKIDTVDCTLSNGKRTKCLEITTKSIASDHKMGPWCPETILDDKSKGGLWFKDGKMYEVDGEFIQNLATIYEDEKWLMYDEDGNILKSETKEDCLKLAGAQLLEEFTNHCIECLPDYVADLDKTFLFPIQPMMLETPLDLKRPPKGKGKGGEKRPNRPPPGKKPKIGGGPSIRGIALNGVAFDAPAPVSLILSGYTIPPLDHAGGHVNMDAGYHYHATTGLSTEIKQADGHAPLIGYAMDGIGLYAHENTDGTTPNDLDDCRGHYDETRGYHYHVDALGSNNFIDCFSGAIAK